MLILAWVFSTSFARAAYLSGRELYEKYRTEVAAEHGVFVTVPIDHTRPASETTDIYVRTLDPFRPEWPSVIYFEGGPGFDCHHADRTLADLAPDHNVILFDSRGVAFSRPARRNAYVARDFYGSERTARDAEVIRKTLGIERWSVAGGSYGALAATVYASLFPASTRALTLIATYHSRSSLTMSRQRGLSFQHRSKHLAPLRELMAEYGLVRGDRIGIGNDVMSLDDWLDTALYHDGEYLLPALAHMLTEAFLGRGPPRSRSFRISTTAPSPLDRRDETVSHQTLDADGERGAAAWPVHVPTTYVHGLADVRTTPKQAILHFKKVARGFRQLVLIPGLGHRVLRSSASFAVPDAIFALPPTMFSAILRGEDLRTNTACEDWLAQGRGFLVRRDDGGGRASK